jgi:hypothetical protein
MPSTRSTSWILALLIAAALGGGGSKKDDAVTQAAKAHAAPGAPAPSLGQTKAIAEQAYKAVNAT